MYPSWRVRHGVVDGERLASLRGRQAERTCGCIPEQHNSFVRQSLPGTGLPLVTLRMYSSQHVTTRSTSISRRKDRVASPSCVRAFLKAMLRRCSRVSNNSFVLCRTCRSMPVLGLSRNVSVLLKGGTMTIFRALCSSLGFPRRRKHHHEPCARRMALVGKSDVSTLVHVLPEISMHVSPLRRLYVKTC